MILHIILNVTLFIVSYIALKPFIAKYLYKDDGNWFYYSVFQSSKLKNYMPFKEKIYHISTYFNLQTIFAFFYKYFGKSDLLFFNKIKIFLYSLQIISIYWIFIFLGHNYFLAFSFSLFSILLFFINSFRFSITYAENFQIIPVLLSFIVFKTSLLYNIPNLIILSGILISFSFHWKVTGILFIFGFPLLFWGTNFLLLLKYYIIGLFIINILLPIIFMRHHKRILLYIFTTTRELIFYFYQILKKINLEIKFLRDFIFYLNNSINKIAEIKINSNHFRKNTYKNYIEKSYTSNRKKMINISAFELYKDYISNFKILTIFAYTTIIYGFYTFDLNILALILFLFISILIWFIQGGVTKNHLNNIIFITYILAIEGIFCLWELNLYSKLLAISSILFYFYYFYSDFIKEWKKNSKYYSFYGESYNLYFQKAEEIGTYIKENTNNREKIFVWGNMPTVYLYAKRKSVDFRFLHTYPKVSTIITEDINTLLDSLTKNPPKFMVLFQRMDIIDEWDITKIATEINSPYIFEKEFKITGKNKNYHSILLYKREDNIYSQLLLEKYHLSNNQDYLKRIKEIEPNNKILNFWLNFNKNKKSYLEYLENINNLEISSLESNLLKITLMKKYEHDPEKIILNIKDKKDWRSLLEVGEYLFNKGDINYAFEAYKKVLQINPFSIEVLNNLGVLFFQIGDIEKAKEMFSKALCFLPNYEIAKNNLNTLNSTKKNNPRQTNIDEEIKKETL